MTTSSTTHARGFGHRDLVLLAIAAVAVAADQATKAWVTHRLRYRTIDVVWTLRFQQVHNSGAAFSLLSGKGAGPAIAVVAVVVVLILARSSRMFESRWGTVAVGLVIGGALGNLLDRLLRSHKGFLQGSVVDFIDLQWWPVFNIADVCVVVGAILLGVVAVFSPEQPAGGDAAAPAGALGGEVAVADAPGEHADAAGDASGDVHPDAAGDVHPDRDAQA